MASRDGLGFVTMCEGGLAVPGDMIGQVVLVRQLGLAAEPPFFESQEALGVSLLERTEVMVLARCFQRWPGPNRDQNHAMHATHDVMCGVLRR